MPHLPDNDPVLTLRDYRPTDLEAAIALFQRAVHEGAAADYTPEQRAAWAPDPPDAGAWAARLGAEQVFVCERNGSLAGFVRVDPRGVLDLLYVHPAHARRGVGGALLVQAIAWARQRGLARLEAEVSVTARPLFERQGFRVTLPQRVERRGVTLDNFRMALELA